MKLNARWALPVYPDLKDQSHWKMCEQILKTQRPNTIQILWIVKNTMSPIIAAIASRLLKNDFWTHLWNFMNIY